MTKTYIYSLILLFSISLQAYAQEEEKVTMSNNAYELGIKQMQWFRSSNISGFGLDTLEQTTIIALGYDHQQGDLHRVQEYGRKNVVQFSAERFMSMNKYVLYGKFDFEQSRGHNKSWADVIDPYNSGPMIFGSAIKAPYDWQSFGLSIKLGSKKESRLMHGVSIDYRVGELARQRDPRTLTDFVDYSISPAVSYQVASNTHLGLNLTYRFKKESMQNFKTIQEDPLISYYIFNGLENYTTIIGRSTYSEFSRYFKNNYWGGDLQVRQSIGHNSNLLISGGFTRMNQAIEGGNVRENPGNFDQYISRGSADLIIKAVKGLHHLSLSGEYINSGLDENVQEYSVTSDPETSEITRQWITLYTYKNRFISDDINIKGEYTYHKFKSSNTDEYRWMIGGGAEYVDFDKKYYLPYSSIAASRLNSYIKGAYQFDMKNSKNINLSLQFGYAPVVDTKMKDLKDNIYTQSVLTPDFDKFYKKDFAHVQVHIMYEMPLKVKKNTMNLFVKGYAKDIMSIQSKKEHLTSIGLSVGILTK